MDKQTADYIVLKPIAERWKPNDYQTYYYITSTGRIDYKTWRDRYEDWDLYNVGNCFRTREYAEQIKNIFIGILFEGR